MLFELLKKEFIEMRSRESQSKIAYAFYVTLRILLVALFVALECFIALSLDKKLILYSTYNTAFDFVVLFLSFMMLVTICFIVIKARKTIFNVKDSQITAALPISPSMQVISKVIYLYVESCLLQLIISTPLIICYGSTRGYTTSYYIFALLYPFIISIFILGFSLLLTIIYQLIYKQIKKSDIAQFVLASILVVGLCYLYQFVLNLFLNALNDSSIGGMFSSGFINTLHSIREYLAPVYHLMDIVTEKTNVKVDVMIICGSSVLTSVLGISLISVVYYHDIKNEGGDYLTKSNKSREIVTESQFIALLKKEMNLLFKDETNLFSYTSLLIMCPFLTFSVISSLNSIIYDNLRFYASYFPELISGINLTLILLFSGVINASASLSMSREKKSLAIVKILPVSPTKQILAKLIVPIVFSFASLLITVIVLIATNVITLPVFFSALFIGALLIVFSNAFGIYCDMHDLMGDKKKIKLSLINETIPLILPLMIFIMFFVLSIFAKLPSWALYLIASLFSIVVLLPVILIVRKKYKVAFIAMEVNE